ncbi:MAG: exonuclease SbcCD subunit D [Gemmatimonadetes bacterium]|nr:exonuclease SbcCD subunit D [Gemmatimonadota bacterium]
MKLLHTADWHVGRMLRGKSRADEHRDVLAEIARIAAQDEVDLIIVAGDLFDSSAPAPESEQIVYNALIDLARTGAEVVVIAGNHDNPQRLAAVRPLLEFTRVRTVAFPARADNGGVIDVRLRSGGKARLALLPFLSQRGIIRADQLMSGDAGDHTMKYAERCARLIEALCAGFDDSAINIIVSHLTVAGAEPGGGEREAHTIFDYYVPPNIFPTTAHYVALGHLHRAQQLAGACPIWYSGSPLQLDFGETANDPSVLLVRAKPDTPARVETVALRAGRRLRSVRGSIAQLEALRDEFGDDFLRVIVSEPARIGLADDVRELLPNAVDVVIAHEYEPSGPIGPPVGGSPVQLFEDYLRDNNIEEPALAALFRELLESPLVAE